MATFVVLILLIFVFTYVNGFRDGCNVVATLIASRAMKPKIALAFASLVEFLSPFSIFIIGASVSKTIQKLVSESYYASATPEVKSVALSFITAGVVAAIIWNMGTWFFAIPSSSSHALIGGVVGAGIAAYSTKAIAWSYFFTRIVLMLFLAPAISFAVGYLVMRLINLVCRGLSRKANVFFKYEQWVNMVFLAFNHSYNDSQKSIGIIMIIVGICGFGAPMADGPFWLMNVQGMPLWAIVGAAFFLALGIALGGFKIIKTVGLGIYRVRPVHSFSSQLASAVVIMGSSLVGAPVSASQIVSSSIMGVGSAERVKAVNWGVTGKILLSWVITLPVAGAIGAVMYYLFYFLIFAHVAL